MGYTKLDDRVFGYGYRASLPLIPTIVVDDSTSSNIRTGSTYNDQEGYQTVIVPFEDFTLDWDWNTGEEGTSCQDDASYCPDAKTLKNMETLTITAQGSTDGIVQELRVKSISGTGCDAPTTIIVDNG